MVATVPITEDEEHICAIILQFTEGIQFVLSEKKWKDGENRLSNVI